MLQLLHMDQEVQMALLLLQQNPERQEGLQLNIMPMSVLQKLPDQLNC